MYHRPYDPLQPVICLDETSKSLHAHCQEPQPLRPAVGEKPARPPREEYEYLRNGTGNLFLWFEPLAARRRVKATERRTRVDRAEVLRERLDVHYSHAEKLVLVGALWAAIT